MKKISTRLWRGMMILVIMIIVLLWLFQIVFLEKFYFAIEKNNAISESKSIVKQIVEGIETEQDALENSLKKPSVMEALEVFIYKKQLLIEITDVNDERIYREANSNFANIPGTMKDGIQQSHQVARDGDIFSQTVHHPKFGYTYLILGLPIMKADIFYGTMVVTLPMAPVSETVAILKTQLMIITAILLIAALVISYFISRGLAGPISIISRQVEHYSSGHFLARNHEEGSDEIGQLAMRMNHMGETLTQNDRLQKELIANVSHELRTPLTLIRGFAETIKDVTGEDAIKRDKQLGAIIDEAERMTKLVEDILNLSQLQSGSAVLEWGTFSLLDLLKDLELRFSNQTNPRTFSIHYDEPIQAMIRADKKRLEQVFYNLLINAFRHTTEIEEVSIHLINKLNHYRVEVIDTGEGIESSDLEHIFERYYRGKTSRDKGKGSGLGLAIVKSILEMHHFEYGVKSVVGEGTTFWFEINK